MLINSTVQFRYVSYNYSLMLNGVTDSRETCCLLQPLHRLKLHRPYCKFHADKQKNIQEKKMLELWLIECEKFRFVLVYGTLNVRSGSNISGE